MSSAYVADAADTFGPALPLVVTWNRVTVPNLSWTDHWRCVQVSVTD